MSTVSRVFLLVILTAVASPALAATLYMTPTEKELHPGDTVTLAVRVDTDEDECINVVDGIISYDPAIQPVDTSRGNSILPIWVEEPTIDTANNRITFAGGIPNGYCGRIQGDPRLTNTLLEVVFQVPGLRIGFGDDNDPIARVEFAPETSVYLNDGLGTKAPLAAYGSSVYVHKTPGSSIVNEWRELVLADDGNPEEFSITLNKDDQIFNQQYYIVFNTTDKQTGIAHYEVIEEPIDDLGLFKWGRVDAPWVKARSPYVLEDQTLNSIIRVKAVDKAGNEYIATLIPDESLRTLSTHQLAMYGAIAAGAILLIIMLVSLWFVYRRRKKSQVVVEEELEE